MDNENESGVHRLVRISPFDSSARRHTSFIVFGLSGCRRWYSYQIEDSELRIDTLDQVVQRSARKYYW